MTAVATEFLDALDHLSPPAMPRAALLLLDETPDTVELDDLVDAAQSDPAIAAAVLRAMHSPIYRGASELDLGAALARLGSRRAFEVVVTGALTSIFRPKPPFQALALSGRRHAECVGDLAAALATANGVDPAAARVVALMLDVALPSLIDIACGLAAALPHDELRNDIRELRIQAALRVARKWSLHRVVQRLDAIVYTPAERRAVLDNVVALADIYADTERAFFLTGPTAIERALNVPEEWLAEYRAAA